VQDWGDLQVDPRKARPPAHRLRAIARATRPRTVVTSAQRRYADVGRLLRDLGSQHLPTLGRVSLKSPSPRQEELTGLRCT
jgi:hypothetical protein